MSAKNRGVEGDTFRFQSTSPGNCGCIGHVFFWISQELRFFSKEIEGPYWTSLKMVIDGWEIPPKSTLPCAI